MRKLMISLAAVCAVGNVLADAEWSGSGTLTANSLEELNAVSPLWLGSGTIRYLGESGTCTGTLKFNGLLHKAGTLFVDGGKTLALTAVETTAGSNAFVKAGAGELNLKNVTVTRFGASSPGTGGTGSSPHWDADGNFDSNADGSLMVQDGTLSISGGDVQSGGTVLVGVRGTNAPCLKLDNGAKLTAGGALYMARGTHSTNENQVTKVLVDGGSLLKASCFSSGWSNGMPSPYLARSLVDVRGGSTVQFGASERVYLGQSFGYTTLRIDDHSRVTSDRDNVTEGCLQLGIDATTTNTVTVTDGSLLGGYSLGLRSSTSLTAEDSTIAFDRTDINRFVSTSTEMLQGGNGRGYLSLNGVTLSNYTARTFIRDWFTTHTNILVGAKGLKVVSVGAEAVLDGIPTKASGTSGQTIVKSGSGRVALRPSELPVTATEGPLAFYTDSRRTRAFNDANSKVPSAAVTGAAGESVDAIGEYAFANLALAHPSGTIRLLARGDEAYIHTWRCNKSAWVMPGGAIRLTPGQTSAATYGNVVNREKIRIDESFEISWDYFAHHTTATVANGFFLFFENSAGLNVTGEANWGLDGLANSFAAGFENGADSVRFVEDGTLVEDAVHKHSVGFGSGLPDGRDKELRCKLAYDAEKHEARFSYACARGYWEHAYAIDLATKCGGAEAYFGFCAANAQTFPTEHCIEHVRVAKTGTKTGDTLMGGRLTVAADATQKVELAPLGAKAGFAMNSLSYGDGATLDVGIAESDGYAASHPSVPDLTDPSLWETWGATNSWTPVWHADGTVQLATNMVNPSITTYKSYTSGGICTKDLYPLNGDWTAEFDYDLAKCSNPAADYLYFSVGSNVKPSTEWAERGVSFRIRFYNSSCTPTHQTSLTVRKQYSQVIRADGADADELFIAPIDLQKQRKAHVKVMYAAAEKKVTVAISNDAGSYTATYSNVDLPYLFNNGNYPGKAMTKFGFRGQVGGSWTEHRIGNFRVACDALARSQPTVARTDEAYLAFDAMSGTGTLVKKGEGSLGFFSPTNGPVAALRVEEGGLRLMKRPLDPFTVGAGAGFVFSDWDGSYTRANGVKIGRFSRSNQAVSANSLRRVRVDRSWRCTFTLDLRHPTNNDANQADALSVFLHNSSRGNEVCGTCYDSAAYRSGGIDKSVALGWYVYLPSANYGLMYYGTNGNFDKQAALEYGLRLYGRVTDVTLTWDRTTKKLVSTLSRAGEEPVTCEVATVDIPVTVGDKYAYLGFGTGGGGSQMEALFNDLKFETTEDVGDELADAKYANAVTLTADETPVVLDSTVANGTYRLADTVRLTAQDPVVVATAADAAGTLALGAVTADGTNVTFRAENGAKISVESVSGAQAVTVDGGTLAIGSATAFDPKTRLYLVNGAALQLDYEGVLSVKDVFVGGVRTKGSFAAGDVDWIVGGSGRLSSQHGLMILLR